MSSSVGERIKELRTALKLTQVQFAENIGVKGGVVSAWEKGSAPLPQGRLLIICGEYGVNSDWIMRGEGEMFSEAPNGPKSRREAALEFLCSMIRKLPDDSRTEAVEFLRELVRLADVDYEGYDTNDPNVAKNFRSSDDEGDANEYQVSSADEDFDDEEDDEYDFESDELDDINDEYDDSDSDEDDSDDEPDASGDADVETNAAEHDANEDAADDESDSDSDDDDDDDDEEFDLEEDYDD